jgi:hypothetical protein
MSNSIGRRESRDRSQPISLNALDCDICCIGKRGKEGMGGLKVSSWSRVCKTFYMRPIYRYHGFAEIMMNAPLLRLNGIAVFFLFLSNDESGIRVEIPVSGPGNSRIYIFRRVGM